MRNLVRPLLVTLILFGLAVALAACEKDRPAPKASGTGTPRGTAAALPATNGTPHPASGQTPAAPAALTPGAQPGAGTAAPGTLAPPTPQPLLPAPTPIPAQSGNTTTSSGAQYFMYVVATGDSLGTLAKRFNTSVESLLALNQMTNPDVLAVGQQLKIPGEVPPELGGVGSYTVQAGDTLADIARRYNMASADLQKLNGMDNPDALVAGQVLKVQGVPVAPASNAAAPAAAAATRAPATTTYTVRPGDTLSNIAARYGTTARELMALNSIANANQIYPNQVLRIPGNARAAAPAPSSRTYVVQRGDTLYSIATRYGVTAAALQAANNISNPNQIYTGQTLHIPEPQAAADSGSRWGTRGNNIRVWTGGVTSSGK